MIEPVYTEHPLRGISMARMSALRDRLRPDVEFHIYRHGNAAPQASTADGTDFQRQLTEKGRSQVRRLGQKIVGIPYDLVISSPAPRAIHTALIATVESRIDSNPMFHIGTGVQFYSPTTPGHFAELLRIGAGLQYNNYGEYLRADTMSIWPTFRAEMLGNLLGILGIAAARQIFVSNHGVIGSCLAEALLQVLAGEIDEQSREVLYNTSAAECSCFQVSRAGVQYIDYLAT
ncbi:MAG: histidine phosphatase family protein [Candidatus Moraniibacteriota bacterium]|nr:MAG: histidine phosphatase family protein [Candidatus Moranbacteria bacterium]